jgi:hypothetical protein
LTQSGHAPERNPAAQQTSGLTKGRWIVKSLQSLRQTPLQWIIVALVKASNAVAIEAFVTGLHQGALRARERKLLNGEPDRLCCIAKRR